MPRAALPSAYAPTTWRVRRTPPIPTTWRSSALLSPLACSSPLLYYPMPLVGTPKARRRPAARYARLGSAARTQPTVPIIGLYEWGAASAAAQVVLTLSSSSLRTRGNECIKTSTTTRLAALGKAALRTCLIPMRGIAACAPCRPAIDDLISKMDDRALAVEAALKAQEAEIDRLAKASTPPATAHQPRSLTHQPRRSDAAGERMADEDGGDAALIVVCSVRCINPNHWGPARHSLAASARPLCAFCEPE